MIYSLDNIKDDNISCNDGHNSDNNNCRNIAG